MTGRHCNRFGRLAWREVVLALRHQPTSRSRLCLGPGLAVGLARGTAWHGPSLLRKVFSLDVLACPECGGRMELMVFIAEAAVAKRILDHLGLASTGPPLARAVAPDEAVEPGPDHAGADPIYEY